MLVNVEVRRADLLIGLRTYAIGDVVAVEESRAKVLVKAGLVAISQKEPTVFPDPPTKSEMAAAVEENALRPQPGVAEHAESKRAVKGR